MPVLEGSRLGKRLSLRVLGKFRVSLEQRGKKVSLPDFPSCYPFYLLSQLFSSHPDFRDIWELKSVGEFDYNSMLGPH